MSRLQVRPARLDDTAAISVLARARITAWQRLKADGQVEDVTYDRLTIYERWLHGGPWLSVETGAIRLNHLLRGAGLALVAEAEGVVIGYTEIYTSSEPAPYGLHLNMLPPTATDDAHLPDLIQAFCAYLDEHKPTRRAERLLVSAPLNAFADLYTRQGFSLLTELQRYSLPARMGQGFYRVTEDPAISAEHINGWSLSVGRLDSARAQWEDLWPHTWDGIPELRQRRLHRLHVHAAGQEALVGCQQQLYAPRSVDVYVWSPRPLSTQMLTAIRDWAHREGYRTLVLLIPETLVKVLGAEAEADGYSQQTYTRPLP